jgi:hypothetical protein
VKNLRSFLIPQKKQYSEMFRFAQHDKGHLLHGLEPHFAFAFASVASVFNSGVRESGSRPNKFPNADAAL